MFKMQIKDYENHYLIEEVVEVGFTVFSVLPEFSEIKSFDSAVGAINFCLLIMGRDK